MTLKEFAETIEFNIEHNIKHAVLGLGAPGVGKSQVIRQIGEKYGYKVIDIRLAQMSEVEIGGLIYPNEDRTKTKWLSPEILPDEERDGKNTILLLDEITSCPKRVQVAAYQLILDRRVGQYHLPEGTFVVALGNREDDDGVYIQLAGPLADRFEIHYIDVDFRSWKFDFALKHGIHPYVVDYLTFKPGALHTQEAEKDSMVFATPRSWKRVSDILKIDSDVSKNVIKNKILGNIGTREGIQFLEFCSKQKKYVVVDDFLNGSKPAPNDSSEVMILVSALVDKVSFLKNCSNFSALSDDEFEQVEQVIRGVFRLPNSEYIMIALRSLLDVNRALVKAIFAVVDDPAITRFVLENQYVLGISQ